MAALPRLNIERYRDIGAYLHDVRLQQKRDINEIAQELNIRAVHLEAIERSNMAALPGMAYARGFIVAYAEELGLHGETVWTRYQKMQQIEEEAPLYVPHAESQHDLPAKGASRVALLMLALVGFLWFQSLPKSKSSLVDMSILESEKEADATIENVETTLAEETVDQESAPALAEDAPAELEKAVKEEPATEKPDKDMLQDCIPTIASPCSEKRDDNAASE